MFWYRFMVWYRSSAKRHSPDFTLSQLPPGYRICLFIRQLNSPGSIQPGCHCRRTKLFKRTSLHCRTRYPLAPESRVPTCEQSALPRNTASEHIQRSRGSNPRPLACTSRTLLLNHDGPTRLLFYTFLVLPKHTIDGSNYLSQNMELEQKLRF